MNYDAPPRGGRARYNESLNAPRAAKGASRGGKAVAAAPTAATQSAPTNTTATASTTSAAKAATQTTPSAAPATTAPPSSQPAGGAEGRNAGSGDSITASRQGRAADEASAPLLSDNNNSSGKDNDDEDCSSCSSAPAAADSDSGDHSTAQNPVMVQRERKISDEEDATAMGATIQEGSGPISALLKEEEPEESQADDELMEKAGEEAGQVEERVSKRAVTAVAEGRAGGFRGQGGLERSDDDEEDDLSDAGTAVKEQGGDAFEASQSELHVPEAVAVNAKKKRKLTVVSSVCVVSSCVFYSR